MDTKKSPIIYPDDIPIIRNVEVGEAVFDVEKNELVLPRFLKENEQEMVEQSASDGTFILSPESRVWIEQHFRQLQAIGPVVLEGDGTHFFLTTTLQVVEYIKADLPTGLELIDTVHQPNATEDIEKGVDSYWVGINSEKGRITATQIRDLLDQLYEQVKTPPTSRVEQVKTHELTHVFQSKFAQDGEGKTIRFVIGAIATAYDEKSKNTRARFRPSKEVMYVLRKYNALVALYEAEAISSEIVQSTVHIDAKDTSFYAYALRLLLFLDTFRQPKSKDQQPKIIRYLYSASDKLTYATEVDEYVTATLLLLGGEKAVHESKDRIVDISAFGESEFAPKERIVETTMNIAVDLINKIKAYVENPQQAIEERVTPAFRDKLRAKINELQGDLLHDLESLQKTDPDMMGDFVSVNLRDLYGRKGNRH